MWPFKSTQLSTASLYLSLPSVLGLPPQTSVPVIYCPNGTADTNIEQHDGRLDSRIVAAEQQQQLGGGKRFWHVIVRLLCAISAKVSGWSVGRWTDKETILRIAWLTVDQVKWVLQQWRCRRRLRRLFQRTRDNSISSRRRKRRGSIISDWWIN